MTVLYRGLAVSGSPADIIEAMRGWSGFTDDQTTRQYKKGVRRRAYIMYKKRLPWDDAGMIQGLADIGELHIIKE